MVLDPNSEVGGGWRLRGVVGFDVRLFKCSVMGRNRRLSIRARHKETTIHWQISTHTMHIGGPFLLITLVGGHLVRVKFVCPRPLAFVAICSIFDAKNVWRNATVAIGSPFARVSTRKTSGGTRPSPFVAICSVFDATTSGGTVAPRSRRSRSHSRRLAVSPNRLTAPIFNTIHKRYT